MNLSVQCFKLSFANYLYNRLLAEVREKNDILLLPH
jgi:hypothetical protein